MSQENEKHTNRLIKEKSPYLLQHAHNPVDWYPWGSDAFEKAKKENKPIFLSIGYSTCHWCHVMEKESFEDLEVAKLINATFIPIKVDREERPDIDSVYMKVCQLLTGSGGWPLTIIMTPEKNPFFAATYIPKENRFGRLGLLELIFRITKIWKDRQAELEDNAKEVITTLQTISKEPQGEELGREEMDIAFQHLDRQFDREHGGFGLAPKFPTPHILLFLLRYWKRPGKEKALRMVEKTLQSMRRGGIFDHLGFGFHRYSTDSRWLLPHFEKMLYDQALLAMAYIEAFQITQNDRYKKTAKEIFSYVIRDLKSPEGAFYSAEDADSEDEEGKFYLWTKNEIQKALKKDEAELAIRVFNIEEKGNFIHKANRKRTGRNILYLHLPHEETASEFKISLEELETRLEKIRQQLFAIRKKRIRPFRDDKILTDWNGLMIAALAKGAQAFDEPDYAQAACEACFFILKNMRSSNGKLRHSYLKGESSIDAFLDDYAFLIWALIELYEATFDLGFLEEALKFNDILLKHFWDEEDGGFYLSPDEGETLFFRQKEIHDGAIPAGNSVQMMNLLRLGRLTSRSELEDKARQVGRANSTGLKRSPSAFTMLLSAVHFELGPTHEVVILGHSASDDTKTMLRALRSEFFPNKVTLFIPTDKEVSDMARLFSYAVKMSAIKGKATAYVCHNYSCQQPTTEIKEMLRSLGSKKLQENQF